MPRRPDSLELTRSHHATTTHHAAATGVASREASSSVDSTRARTSHTGLSARSVAVLEAAASPPRPPPRRHLCGRLAQAARHMVCCDAEPPQEPQQEPLQEQAPTGRSTQVEQILAAGRTTMTEEEVLGLLYHHEALENAIAGNILSMTIFDIELQKNPRRIDLIYYIESANSRINELVKSSTQQIEVIEAWAARGQIDETALQRLRKMPEIRLPVSRPELRPDIRNHRFKFVSRQPVRDYLRTLERRIRYGVDIQNLPGENAESQLSNYEKQKKFILNGQPDQVRLTHLQTQIVNRTVRNLVTTPFGCNLVTQEMKNARVALMSSALELIMEKHSLITHEMAMISSLMMKVDEDFKLPENHPLENDITPQHIADMANEMLTFGGFDERVQAEPEVEPEPEPDPTAAPAAH
jgi:hypothetical protein